MLASFKELARVSFESGKAGFTDVLSVEMEEAALQNKLRYLEDSQAPVRTQFEQLLNTNLPEAVSMPDTLWEEVLVQEKTEIFQTILANNPRLQELQHTAQAYRNQAKVNQKMGLPSVSLGVSYTIITPRTGMEMSGMDMSDNGRDAFVFPQVGVRMPLYRKKYKAMQKQSQLQREAAAFSQEGMHDQLLTELEKLYADYLNAQREVKLYRHLADLAARTLDLLQTEFSTGETDFEEIIRVERQLINYQLEEEKARVERNNFVYSIQYLMGK